MEDNSLRDCVRVGRRGRDMMKKEERKDVCLSTSFEARYISLANTCRHVNTSAPRETPATARAPKSMTWRALWASVCLDKAVARGEAVRNFEKRPWMLGVPLLSRPGWLPRRVDARVNVVGFVS